MNIRRRRKKQQVRLTIFLSSILCILFILLFIQLASNTVIGSKDISVKYLSVEVYANDTLWDLSKEFMNTDYNTIETCIEKIIKVNGLKSETIYTGQRLIIPVIEETFDE